MVELILESFIDLTVVRLRRGWSGDLIALVVRIGSSYHSIDRSLTSPTSPMPMDATLLIPTVAFLSVLSVSFRRNPGRSILDAARCNRVLYRYKPATVSNATHIYV